MQTNFLNVQGASRNDAKRDIAKRYGAPSSDKKQLPKSHTTKVSQGRNLQLNSAKCVDSATVNFVRPSNNFHKKFLFPCIKKQLSNVYQWHTVLLPQQSTWQNSSNFPDDNNEKKFSSNEKPYNFETGITSKLESILRHPATSDASEQLKLNANENYEVAKLLYQLSGSEQASWDCLHGPFRAEFPYWYLNLIFSDSSLDKWTNVSTQAIMQRDKQTGKNVEKKLIPSVFTWSHGGHVVYLVGSFTGWYADKIRMTRNGHEFVTIKELPQGIHYYKFIVDDHWKFSPSQPTNTDSQGNVNNVLDISDYASFNFTVPKEYEKARDESYSQFVPSANDYTTDAPIIPVLLSRSNCVAAETQSRIGGSLHVLANHVYIDSQASSFFGPNVTCITSTQRWRQSRKSSCSLSGQRFSTLTYVTFNPLFSYHGDPVFELQAALLLQGIVGHRRPRDRLT